MTKKKSNEFLTIELEGSAVKSGRIGIIALRDLITEFYKLIERTGLRLADYEESARRGRRPKNIEKYLGIDLVRIDHGSPKTILGFERASYEEEGLFPGVPDFGTYTYEKALTGLSDIQDLKKPVPDFIDHGILEAMGDLGGVFGKGIKNVYVSLNSRPKSLKVKYTQSGYKKIIKRIAEFENELLPKEPEEESVSGRLLMVDFKKGEEFKCKIYPPIGEPVGCIFDENKSDKIKANLRRFVRVTGIPTRKTPQGKITGIQIKSITPLEIKTASIFPDFWNSLSLKELAEMQGVKPVDDVSILIGQWPGDPDDDFE